MDNQPKEMAQPTQKKKSMLLFLPLGFLIALGVLLFIILNRSSQNASTTSPANPTQVVEKMEKVEGKLVEGASSLVPIYPNATIEQSFKREVGQNTEYYSVWVTQRVTVGEVITFYEQELTKGGWTIDELPVERNERGEEGIEAHKGNMWLTLMIESEKAGDPTEITVDVFVKKG